MVARRALWPRRIASFGSSTDWEKSAFHHRESQLKHTKFMFFMKLMLSQVSRETGVISPRREGAAGHTLQFLEVIPIRPNAGKREVVP